RRHTRFSRDWSSDVCSSDLKDDAQQLVSRKLAGNLTELFLREAQLFGKQLERAELPARLDHMCKRFPQRSEVPLASQDHILAMRSEERRGGKECRAGRSREH